MRHQVRIKAEFISLPSVSKRRFREIDRRMAVATF